MKPTTECLGFFFHTRLTKFATGQILPTVRLPVCSESLS